MKCKTCGGSKVCDCVEEYYLFGKTTIMIFTIVGGGFLVFGLNVLYWTIIDGYQTLDALGYLSGGFATLVGAFIIVCLFLIGRECDE